MDEFANSQLIFTFLTPHASDMLEPRNGVPFYELPIYRTANFTGLKGAGRDSICTDGTLFSTLTASTTTVNSANVQTSSSCSPVRLWATSTAETPTPT